jgi:hypothetical protein
VGIDELGVKLQFARNWYEELQFISHHATSSLQLQTFQKAMCAVLLPYAAHEYTTACTSVLHSSSKLYAVAHQHW